MPAIEPGDTFSFILGGDAGLVECSVARVFELGFSESFVIVNHAIADKLDLWDSGNGLKVRVEDGLLGAFSLVVSVSIALGFGIKRLRKYGDIGY
jgi:hypothetical protein